MSALASAAGLSYREAKPEDWRAGDPTALLVHGWPESSYMWRDALPAIAAAGYRAIAPDLAGYGDSAPNPPGSWEHHIEMLEDFRVALELQPTALVMHDWGTLIGLRWACDHPDAITSLIVSDGGFFTDRKWHDLANLMRTPGEGEALMEAFTREGFDAALRAACPGLTDAALEEYWKLFADPVRRQGSLELYRSGDFEKLEPYQGRLATLGVPALVLWGATDPFAGVDLAHRFQQDLPGSELVIIEDAGHFVWEDKPADTARIAADFLARVKP
ncbi:MAG TPA: alpha/beta fold hydrolase [Solirubrobacteraceae bacterium]|nr:alpha/beta fold hydrolase [Solirubrobacteraceae bacterium]